MEPPIAPPVFAHSSHWDADPVEIGRRCSSKAPPERIGRRADGLSTVPEGAVFALLADDGVSHLQEQRRALQEKRECVDRMMK